MGETVAAAADGITVQEQAAWRKRVTFFPARKIFGLDYSAAEPSFGPITRSAQKRYHRSRLPESGTSIPPAGPVWLKRLVKSKAVLVKCKKGIVAIGAGLPDNEVRHLYAVIRQAFADSRR